MIYCFSGNGNSMYVARQLAERLGEEVTRIDRSFINNKENWYGRSGGRTIWVFPVHCWGMPEPVKLLMVLMKIKDSRHYMVATCGDDIGMTHRQWRLYAKVHNWDCAAAFSVQMPNTYTPLPGFDVDSPEVAGRKLADAPARIDHIADLIKAGFRGDDIVKGAFPRFKSKILYPLYMKYGIKPDRFNCDTQLCIGCGKCVEACPSENVAIIKGQHYWGVMCTQCLACYHVCPVHAINYGKSTIRKGQYRCEI